MRPSSLFARLAARACNNLLSTVSTLIDRDGDGFLLGPFGFGHVDLQYPVRKGGLHLIGLHVTGQSHRHCE